MTTLFWRLTWQSAESSLTLDASPRSWLRFPPAVTILHHPNTLQELSSGEVFPRYRKVKAEEHGEARDEFCREQPYGVVHSSSGQPKSFTRSQAHLTSWVPFVPWQDLNQHFWVYPGASHVLNTGWPVHIIMAESRSWGQLHHVTPFCGSVTHSSSGQNSTAGHWRTAPVQATEKDAFGILFRLTKNIQRMSLAEIHWHEQSSIKWESGWI